MTGANVQNVTTPETSTGAQPPAPLPASIKLEKFEALTEDTYETTAQTARANLVVGGYWPFFSGKRPKPKEGYEDWERFNLQLVAYLQTRMHPTLQHHLDDVETAEKAWEKLREKFREKGTVGQLNLLWTVLRTRFSKSSPKAITESIHELNGGINRLVEIGVPTREEWKAMFFLHALGDDGEFEMMRETLETLLAADSLTSQKIIDRLGHEAQRLRGQAEEKTAQEAVFAARTAQPKTKTKKSKTGCSNCGYTNHTLEKCFRPGGPMNKQKEHKLNPKKEPEKVNAAQDSGSSESEESTYETVAAAFQGSTHDHYNDSDYSMVAHIDLLPSTTVEECSVAWKNSNTREVLLSSITVAPLSARERAIVPKPEGYLYHMDSAATSSCSPYRADFLELAPIESRAIKGVNG
jgi:gag-polypeptide of LTR copia-type